MNTCKQCHRPISNDAIFCNHCNSPVYYNPVEIVRNRLRNVFLLILFIAGVIWLSSCQKDDQPNVKKINGVKWCTKDYSDQFYTYEEALKVIPSGYRLPNKDEIVSDIIPILDTTGYYLGNMLLITSRGAWWCEDRYMFIYQPKELNKLQIYSAYKGVGQKLKLRLIKK